MKKENFIALCLLLMVFSPFYAQVRSLQRTTDNFVDYMDLFYRERTEFLEVYDGTPYNNKNFLLGNIYINDKISATDVALRYNIYSDEMQIKESLQTEDEKLNALIKSPDISITILNNKYVYIQKGKGLEKGGYFQVITTGKIYSLYKKLGKKYYEARKAKTSFERDLPAKFEDRTSYYIHFSNGGMVELPDSKKKRYKAFGESEAIVKAYTKEKKLDISKEKDLKKVIIYLDNQISISQQ